MHMKWNVADYFNQNKDKLLCNNNDGDNIDVSVAGITLTDPQELLYPDFPGVTTLAEMSEFDKLWMCLFTKLGKYNNYIIKYYYLGCCGIFIKKKKKNYCRCHVCMHIAGELCIDPRPAVRKSAGQTLFSTISAHANLLTSSSWNAVLWQVI